jgi:SAM-dependent methyltransferase
MSSFRREEIDQRLTTIKSDYFWRFEDYGDQFRSKSKALNIGCDSGYEALAIMWFLQAESVLGIDIDIGNVNTYAASLQTDLSEAKRSLNYQWVTDDDREWWQSSVPEFLKREIFPEFLECDAVSLSECLPSSKLESFDLVYCSNVLCHIHTNQGSDAILATIGHVRDFLEEDGLFVADEPSDEELLYFEEAFDRAFNDVSSQTDNGKTLIIGKKT